ncbi:hypothetical protein [Georgenia alba]|uniref:DUF3592 domain-containing protein n=1 Tax=Georgenia alba TaxID=2233858 RepID=A0ABW2QBK0_9MICO
MTSRKHKVWGITLGIVIGAGVLAFLVYVGISGNNDRADADAEATGVITEERIIEGARNSGDTEVCEFTVTIGGTEYHGLDACDHSTVRAGDEVTVNYIEDDVHEERLYLGGDVSEEEMDSQSLKVTAFILGFCVLMAGLYYLFTRDLRKKTKAATEARRI